MKLINVKPKKTMKAYVVARFVTKKQAKEFLKRVNAHGEDGVHAREIVEQDDNMFGKFFDAQVRLEPNDKKENETMTNLVIDIAHKLGDQGPVLLTHINS